MQNNLLLSNKIKITITGSLSNVVKKLAGLLIAQGYVITVISSKTEKQKDIEALGAAAAIGSLKGTDFLPTAFEGLDSVLIYP